MKTGFTLAEVLITLGIIGIVAAMTIPSLVQKNQNKALEASFKKNYSVIQQAFDMYHAEHGERLKATDLSSRNQNNGMNLKFEIQPYFKVLHDCGLYGSQPKACVPYMGNQAQDDERNSKVYKTYNNTPLTNLALFDDGQFVLTDGSLILIENPNGSSFVFITVDVNGYNKNPNKWGHDLFTFQLMNDGRILPMGAEGTRYTNENIYCSVNSTEQINGIACTYKALAEKDYFNNLPR